ncbi:MAG: ABC transporter ATP-binding protein [Actinomycetaceae bacterium]|nr:ABC transporter ATP-binding protein [Actinomycetaceae bacterium]
MSTSDAAGATVDLCGVSLRRAGTDILRDFTWRIRAGERWVILGPNGAGKTTLVRILSGRLFPSSGTVDVLGRRLGRVDVREEIWGRVALASSALNERFPYGQTVIETVRTGKYGYLATWRESYTSEDEERACALLEQFDITHLADRRFASLSSGERQRTALARAMMTEPEILILDEPTSSLDLGGREYVLSSLDTIAQKTTPILVTHHVEEIPPAFTHVLLIKDGTVFAAGEIGQTLTSEMLSELFAVPLRVHREGGRFFAVAR